MALGMGSGDGLRGWGPEMGTLAPEERWPGFFRARAYPRASFFLIMRFSRNASGISFVSAVASRKPSRPPFF